MKNKYAVLLCCMFILSACIQREMIVVVPPAQNTAALSAEVSQHCRSATDTKYLTATDIVSAGVINPPRSLQQHVNGCAAVKFQIDENGKASSVSILREYPEDYGYGDAVVDAVKRSTYKAPTNANDWFIINNTTVYNQR